MQETQLRLSIWGGFYKELGAYGAIDRLIANGYYAMEFPDIFTKQVIDLPLDEIKAQGGKIGEYAKERNFEISQGHLLFDHEFFGDKPYELLTKNIDFFHAIGIKNMVLHVVGVKGEPRDMAKKERYAAQVKRLGELLDYVGDRDITLCLENIVQSANTEKSEYLMEFIHEFGDTPKLGICLDTGHLNRSNGTGHTNQTFEDFFAGAEGRIKALHINGNAGTEDQHLFPFTGKEGLRPDWVNFISALLKSGYTGLFNYEVPGERNYVPLAVRDMKLRYAKEIFEYMTGGGLLADASSDPNLIL